MKSTISQTRITKLTIFRGHAMSFGHALAVSLESSSGGPGGAIVGAIEGHAEVSGDTGQELKKLDAGNPVNPGDAVSTEEKTRLLLRWDTGLMGSLGEFPLYCCSPDRLAVRQPTSRWLRVFYACRWTASKWTAIAVFGYHGGGIHRTAIVR